MNMDVIQPSLKRRVQAFGAPELFDPAPDKRLLVLQMPPMALGPEFAARKVQPFGSAGALVDSARDWVRLVLKSKSPKRDSVFDLPPLDLGQVLHPLSEDDDLLSEMLDDARF